MNAANSIAPSALEYFGGAKAAYGDLARAIVVGRKEKAVTAKQLAAATGLSVHRLRSFETTKAEPRTFEVRQVLRMLTQLGLVIERVLCFRATLKKEDREYWIASMSKADGGFVAACGLHARVEPAIALQLFIRVHALEELFSTGRSARARPRPI